MYNHTRLSSFKKSIVTTMLIIMSISLSAYANAADIIKNNHTINSNHSKKDVYGVKEANKDAVGGHLLIATGGIIKNVYGGFSKNNNAIGNTATLKGGQVLDYFFGGFSENGIAKGNTVTIESGSVTNNVSAGASLTEATGNTTNVTGGKMEFHVYGGDSLQNTSNNIVNFSGGEVGGSLSGGHSRNGISTGNKVNISGGTIENNVSGGESTDGTASGNTASMSGGDIQNAMYGGYAETGTADNNIITITGGKVETIVMGGSTMQGNANGNTVNISGGTLNGDVYGGNSIELGSVNNNIVTIKGAPTFNANSTIIYGGYSKDPLEAQTGNTLNLHAMGVSVKNIADFQTLTFYIQKEAKNNAVFLSLNDTADTHLANTVLNVGVEGDESLLEKGDTVVLIQSKGKLHADAALSNHAQQIQGMSARYTFEIKQRDEHTLIAELIDIKEN